MKTFYFARNTLRKYYDVKAETEEEARRILENERPYYSGRRFMDAEESPFELIDSSWEDEE